MEDRAIVDLYWERDERAIRETQKKFERYCHRIAYNILSSDEDAEECVNDTYLRAWESIPPQRPSVLSAFLGKITRNLALNRYFYNRAEKRAAGIDAALEELEECIPDPIASADPTDEIHIGACINRFLAALPAETRILFVRRYWYLYSIKDLSRSEGISEAQVKTTLYRTRLRLKEFLEKEGIHV